MRIAEACLLDCYIRVIRNVLEVLTQRAEAAVPVISCKTANQDLHHNLSRCVDSRNYSTTCKGIKMCFVLSPCNIDKAVITEGPTQGLLEEDGLLVKVNNLRVSSCGSARRMILSVSWGGFKHVARLKTTFSNLRKLRNDNGSTMPPIHSKYRGQQETSIQIVRTLLVPTRDRNFGIHSGFSYISVTSTNSTCRRLIQCRKSSLTTSISAQYECITSRVSDAPRPGLWRIAPIPRPAES